MEGCVLSFLKAEWKVNNTGSAHWATSSFCHCIVYSLIYGFWLPFWYGSILVEFMILKHQVQVNKTSQIITVYFLPLSILLICLFSFSLFISHIKIMVLLFFNLDYEYIIQKDLKEVIKEICHRMFITVFCVTLWTLKFIDNFITLITVSPVK